MPLSNSQTATLPAEFLPRARREAARYGTDPFLFLREWVQNGRDAGAHTLRFCWQKLENGQVRISCDDDGCGMTTVEAEQVLFRLYATSKDEKITDPKRSSKEKSTANLGRFGVGFWSLLLCSPDSVGVDSLSNSGGVSLLLDVNKEQLTTVAPRRSTQGTKVWVDFPPWGCVDELREKAKLRLETDAGNVRGQKDSQIVDLYFDDVKCNQTLQEHSAEARPYRLSTLVEKRFDGVVGLGQVPMVRLYCGGLLVREETSLEALLPRQSHPVQDLCGLFPVVLVNADELNVLLNRREVSEDALLLQIVRKVEDKLKKEHLHLVEEIAPSAFFFRLKLRFASNYRRVLPIFLGGLGVLLAVAMGLGLGSFTGINRHFSSSTRRAAHPNTRSVDFAYPRSIANAAPPKQGPVVDTLDEQNTRWAFSYTGGGSPLFRSNTLSKISEDQGLSPERLSSVKKNLRRYPGPNDVLDRLTRVEEAAASVRIALGLPRGPLDTAVPVPLGHVLDVESVEFFPKASVEVWVRKDGVAVVRGTLLESSSLQYRTFPGRLLLPSPKIEKNISRRERARRLRQWPKKIRKLLKKWRKIRSVPQKAASVERWVQKKIRYTVAPEDALSAQAKTGAFVTRVLALGFGDCDVVNTLAARMLIDVGVPAQVGIGFVGKDGTLEPQLHAWSEYWNGKGWVVFDASQELAERENSTASSPEASMSSAAIAEVTSTSDEGVLEKSGENARNEVVNRTESSFSSSAFSPTTPTALLLIAFLASFFLLLRRARARRQRGGSTESKSAALAQMLGHLIEHPDAEDSMRLRKRPVLPTLAGKKLSLQEISALGEAGQLLGAPRAFLAPCRLKVLELDTREFQQIDPLLPQILSLRSPDNSKLVLEIKRLLQCACEKEHLEVVFHFTKNAPRFLQEARWPSKAAKPVLLIGTGHPNWPKYLDTDDKPAVFLLVQQILFESDLLSAWQAPLLANVARMFLKETE